MGVFFFVVVVVVCLFQSFRLSMTVDTAGPWLGPSILGAGLWEKKEGKKKSHIDLPRPLQLTGTPFLSCLASVFVACSLCTAPHWATPGSKPGDMRGKARELTPLEVLLQVLASVSNLILLLTFQSRRVVAFKNFVFLALVKWRDWL